MSDKDQIKDLFSEKLGNFEAKVNPELWANVASQVGAATTGAAGASGMSLLTKAIIGISGAAALTTGVVLWNGSNEESKTKQPTKKEVTAVSEKVDAVDSQKERTEPVAVNVNDETPEPIIAPASPINSATPTTGPNDGNAHAGSIIEVQDPIDTTPEPQVTVVAETIDEQKAIESIQKAQEKDKVELENAHNVGLEDEPTKDVKAEVVQEEEVISIEIYDIFTPNGDWRNDSYKIETGETQFKNFEFVIYDQTGSAVMITKDPKFQWTGIDPKTGQLIKKGRYAYILVAETEKGTPIKRSGTITVQY